MGSYFHRAFRSVLVADLREVEIAVRRLGEEGFGIGGDGVERFTATDGYHLACLDDATGALFEEASKDGVTDVHSFNDWAVRIRANKSHDEVLDEWWTKNNDVRRPAPRTRTRRFDGVVGRAALSGRPHGVPHRERKRDARR